ncbi:MAG: hypothetical protein ACSLE1_16405 [Sphingobium sp.]
MVDVASLIEKVKRPPSLPNWVRLNHRRKDDTTRSIAQFVLSRPRHALSKVYSVVSDYVTFRISAEAAFRSLAGISNPIVRKSGREILTALLPWLDENKIEGIRVFHDMSVPFPIGRGVVVPVKPTFVFLKDGGLIPVFVIGWASDPFSPYQKQLLTTVISKAVLTLEQFQDSDALVICVPRIKGSKTERYVRHWWVSEFPELDDDQLREQFDRFGNAIDDVVPIVLSELARRGEI